MDEERHFPRDPATLLPFVCELMPPDAVILPHSKKYPGEKTSDGDGWGFPPVRAVWQRPMNSDSALVWLDDRVH